MALRTRKKVLLAKIESSEGVDASPAAATDAVLCSNLRVSYNPNLITTDEHTGSLDPSAPLVGGMLVGLSFDVFLKGSGSAGTAPEFGKLLKACGWGETVTGTAVPAAPEACGAGGSTTTAELGSTASGTAQTYRGMPITFSSEVSGNSFITDYTSGKIATLTDTFSAIDADTNYQIPVNVLYSPSSGTPPTLTFYVYQDGQLIKIAGARGSFSLSLTTGAEGRITFNFTGMYLSKTDVAVPTDDAYQSTRPPLFKNAVFKLQRTATPLQSLSLDCGNTYPNPENPNALEAFDPAVITGRRLTGTINPLAALVADRDALGDLRAGTQRQMYARVGSTTGNKVGIVIPAAQYTGFSDEDRNGLMAEGLPFEATGSDAGAFLCFH